MNHLTYIQGLFFALLSLGPSAVLPHNAENERILKIGAMTALIYNQDEIDTILARMRNSAVREPIGNVSMSHIQSKDDTYTVGSTTHYGFKQMEDQLFTNLILPIGDEYGVSIFGFRDVYIFKDYSPSSTDRDTDFTNVTLDLFWRNPKNGSYSIGIQHSNCCRNENTLRLGYNYRDTSKGGWSAYSDNTWTDGKHSSTETINGMLYWPQFVLAGSIDLDGDSSGLTAKYEHDLFSLTAARSAYKDYDRTHNRLSLFISDNFMLSTDHIRWTVEGDNTESQIYGVNYQPPNNKYALVFSVKDRTDHSAREWEIGYKINLGRKRSLKAADRDRDPF